MVKVCLVTNRILSFNAATSFSADSEWVDIQEGSSNRSTSVAKVHVDHVIWVSTNDPTTENL